MTDTATEASHKFCSVTIKKKYTYPAQRSLDRLKGGLRLLGYFVVCHGQQVRPRHVQKGGVAGCVLIGGCVILLSENQ